MFSLADKLLLWSSFGSSTSDSEFLGDDLLPTEFLPRLAILPTYVQTRGKTAPYLNTTSNTLCVIEGALFFVKVNSIMVFRQWSYDCSLNRGNLEERCFSRSRLTWEDRSFILICYVCLGVLRPLMLDRSNWIEWKTNNGFRHSMNQNNFLIRFDHSAGVPL